MKLIEKAKIVIVKVTTYIWGILWGEKTPLAVTVALTVGAALLSPLITEKYERQKMQSEYVLSNLRELNGYISDLHANVAIINYSVADGEDAPRQIIEDSRKIIAKINWKLIETAAMLPASDAEILADFQTTLRGVSAALDAKLDVNGCRILAQRVKKMSGAAAQVIQAVGQKADLSGGEKRH